MLSLFEYLFIGKTLSIYIAHTAVVVIKYFNLKIINKSVDSIVINNKLPVSKYILYYI